MSNTKILENASSLERFLNRHVLFVQGIDQNVSKSEVLQVLNQVLKQPQQGRIDILTTQDGKMRGTAFLNFHNEEDAKAALEMYRFALEIRGRPLRMQFASDREFKEIIQGPLVARFKVLIRNIPEELTPEALHERFSQYGEILQVHTACDHYGQHYAIIQYVETASVQAAIRNANRERVLNHVLMVEPYKPNVTYGMLPRNINQTTSSLLQQAGVPAANGGVAGTSRGGTLPGTTYAALQQQQELEVAEQERYFAEGNSDSGGGGGGGGSRVGSAAAAPTGFEISNGGGSPGFSASVPAPPLAASLAVSNFFAATTGPVNAPTAPGSLIHLLTTALHHVQALEEHLCCPITQEPLVDPVVAADGNTYERLAITAWLEQHDTSPLTNEVLAHKGLTPNNLVRKIAEELQGISHPAADGGGTPSAATAGVAAARSAASGDLGGAVAPPPPPPPLPPVAAPAPPPQPEAPAPVPVPVPVPIGGASVASSYHNTHHANPQQPNSHSQSHGQPHPPHPLQPQPHPHTRPQQAQSQPSAPPQFSEYNQLPTVIRPTLMPTPVAFVHVPQAQPQPYQMQGTTYYAYRPMGM
ncbi:hypothetical protein Vretifemale_15186 [Volvox reticuliferus]|uniref:U-box domain-containing protein n=2 Tax=Volvox reticuliferus TaxID=1737510 RepID=A0A8J4CQJ9_9CHLO|nr:hypothetical protein Vretifemale_15186 [Volvox reticuliferus]